MNRNAIQGKNPSARKLIKTLSKATSKFIIITVLMLVLALFLPFAYHMDVGPGPDSIRAMTWEYIEASWYSGFRLWDPLDTLPYTTLRLVFAILVARTLVGASSLRRTIFIGLLGEIQPIAVSAPLIYLIDWPGDPLVPLYIPIPIFLLICAISLFFTRKNYIDTSDTLVPATDEETELGMKVVAIMQTVTEDLDDSGKRAWGKMLGTVEEARYPREKESEKGET